MSSRWTNPTTTGWSVSVGNIQKRLRDWFTSPTLDTTVWTSTTATWDIINLEGNATGSRYLNIVKSVFNQNTESVVESKDSYTLPMRLNAMPSLSQRTFGQEFAIDFVGVNGYDVIEYNTTRPDISINNIVVAANVGTVTCNTAHWLVGWDRIAIKGCQYTPLNVWPSYVSAVVSPTVFQCSITAASNTYSAVGSVEFVDSLDYAVNGAWFLFENATATNTTLALRNWASSRQFTNQNCSTTTASQGTSTSYSDAFHASWVFEIVAWVEDLRLMSRTADATNTASQFNRSTTPILDENKRYKVRLRAKNLSQYTVPNVRITNITKSGTTTATITTHAAHWLTVNSFINIFGVADQTNFPNMTWVSQIASVIDSTNFTIAIGATTTGTSSGGCVSICNGSIPQQWCLSQVVNSIARTNNIYTVTCNTTVTGVFPWEYYTIYGMTGTATQYEGVFKLMRNNGSTLEFVWITNPIGVDFGSITTGGTIIRNTQFRMHGVSVLDYTRNITEIDTARGTVDQARALNVNIANTPWMTQSTGSTASIWNAAGYGWFVVADITSAALTTSNTSATLTPWLIGSIGTYSQQFVLTVGTVTGTAPTMDTVVQESPDSGTTWVDIYHFPRVTASNVVLYSPQIRFTGNRIRYVRTVGWSSPSITNAISRNMFSQPWQVYKNFIDRTINPNTLNTTTPTYWTAWCYNFTAFITTTSATTPAQYQMEWSQDWVSWYSLWSAATATAWATVTINVVDILANFVRLRVSTAGTTVVQNNITITAIWF